MADKRRFTSRTKARKRAADVIFEADLRGMGRDPRVLEDLLRERRVLTAAQTPLPAYSIRVIEGVARDLRRIDALIGARADVPGLDRIPPVDLAVMRVAVWEMLENSDDVPPVTAIDQAVMIVRSISTDTSPGFVNAVLDAVRRDIGGPTPQQRHTTNDEDTPAGAHTPGEVDTNAADQDISDEPPVSEGAPSEDADTASPPSSTSHPTIEELSALDLESLDELLDEY